MLEGNQQTQLEDWCIILIALSVLLGTVAFKDLPSVIWGTHVLLWTSSFQHDCPQSKVHDSCCGMAAGSTGTTCHFWTAASYLPSRTSAEVANWADSGEPSFLCVLPQQR